MCEQNTLAIADLAGTGAAGSLQMLASYRDSRARKSAADKKAALASKKGEDEVRIAGIKTGRLFGAQRAAFAANGLDIAGSPTVLDVLADTSEEGVREAVMIRNNAGREAEGYRTEAASESPFLSAAGNALGTAGTVAGKWYRYKKAGAI